MNSPEFDVAVVGGGPGGSASAIGCALAGLRVALIEREPFPRERPGETLHPGIEPLLRKLGVAEAVLAAGFLRHEGNWIEWGDPRRFERFGGDDAGAWLGIQAWRADFDAFLLARARALGVAIAQPCRALQPIVSGGRVVGVATSGGPRTARWTVDAGGGRHWLARALGIDLLRASPPLTARYGYAEGACAIRDEAPSIAADDAGWTWTARVRPGLYQWTRLALDERGAAADGLPDEFQGLQPRSRPKGADVTWRIAAAPAGPGYFLVGDAAAVLDPASSHGVLRGLMTGMYAAHLIARSVTARADGRQAADAYNGWLGEWFQSDVERLRELYSRHPNPPPWIARRSQSPRGPAAESIGPAGRAKRT